MTNRLFEIWQNANVESVDEFLEHAPVMMHSTNHEGRIAYVSRQWAAKLKYEPAEMVGMRLPDLMTPESRRRAFTREIPRFLRTGKAQNIEYDFVCKDGTIFPALLSGSARYDENGKFTKSLAVIYDNTANKFLELLERKAEQAERENSAKSRFLESMSHELRTPLNAIIGFAQMLNGVGGPISDDQRDEYSGYIMESGERLLKLVNQVLDLSSIEAGNIEVAVLTVDIKPLVHAVVNEASILAHQRSVTLVDEVALAKLPLVLADSERLTQALVNLVANAIKYNRANGEVRIQAIEQEQDLRIIVSDTGVGIPAERQQEVFQPFNRLGAERSSLEGNGVGLSLAKDFIESMGGTIGFSSSVGVGSTFWIELPLAEGATNVITDFPDGSNWLKNLCDSQRGVRPSKEIAS